MVVLGPYVLYKDPKRDVNIISTSLMLCFALFAFGIFMQAISTHEGTALGWARITAVAVSFLCSIFVHLTLVFPEKSPLVKRRKYAPALLYLPSLVFALVSVATDFFVKDVRQYPWGFYGLAGPAVYFYLVYFGCFLGYGVFSLAKSHVRTVGITRKHVDVVLIGAALVIAVSTVTDVPLLMDFFPVPPMTTYSLLIAGILFTYGIVRYELFVLPPMSRLFIPIPEARLKTKLKHRLGVGIGYVLKKPDAGAEVFRDLTMHDIPGLWITTSQPGKIREKYRLMKTPVIWLTLGWTRGEITAPPNKLDKVLKIVSNFFFAVPRKSVVLVDCFRELVMVNGFEKAMDFLSKLGKTCSENNSNLIVQIDPSKFTKKQLEAIEKVVTPF